MEMWWEYSNTWPAYDDSPRQEGHRNQRGREAAVVHITGWSMIDHHHDG